LEVVKALVDSGADIEAKDILSATSLHCPSRFGRLETVQMLLNPGAEIHVQQESKGTATFEGKRRTHGADVHSKDNERSTHMYYASREGHFSIVKALVSGGADIRATNNHGRFPIHLAVRRLQPAVAKYLLQQLYATSF
jgi:ankyrin repeat protein